MTARDPDRTNTVADTETDAALDSFDAQVLVGERRRIQRSLAIAVLKAVRSIPDGEIRNGCVIHDGAKVREGLRQAWLAIADDLPEERTP